MRWTRGTAGAAFMLAAACGGSHRGALVPAPVHVIADELAERSVFALEADGRMEAADSLYGADAELIAAGQRRVRAPRFAGVEPGGQVAVGSSRVEVRQRLAWALVEYRWVASGRDLLHEGRATLIFAQQADGRWLITHAHSSLLN